MAEQSIPPQGLLVNTGPLVAGFSQSALRGSLDSAALNYSQLALKVVQYIQGVIADAVNAGQAVALKVATPLADAINQGQATINQLGSQIGNQIGAGIATATAPCGSGCEAQQGATPGQYHYNVWQDFDVPAVVAFSVGSANPPSPPANWCFRAGWEDYYDAIAYKAKIQGTPPPEGCRLPGGLASPPPVLTPTGPPVVTSCPTYDYYLLIRSGNIVACQAVCHGAAPPGPDWSGTAFNVTAAQLASLEQQGGIVCGRPPPPPPPPTVTYYAGCINGQPVSWDDSSQPPPGVTGTVGPYPSQDAALAAAKCSPVLGGGPPAAGPCVCVTGSADKTACLYVDLCDWKEFEDALFNALCRWYKECLCKLNAEALAVQEDCEGIVGPPWTEYLSGLGAVIHGSASIDDVVSASAAGLPASYDTSAGGVPPGQ